MSFTTLTFLPQTHNPQSNYEKNTSQAPVEGAFYNTWPVYLKTVKMQKQESLRNSDSQ